MLHIVCRWAFFGSHCSIEFTWYPLRPPRSDKSTVSLASLFSLIGWIHQINSDWIKLQFYWYRVIIKCKSLNLNVLNLLLLKSVFIYIFLKDIEINLNSFIVNFIYILSYSRIKLTVFYKLCYIASVHLLISH